MSPRPLRFWHRVQTLRPRLAPEVRVSRQIHGGTVHHVLYNGLNNRSVRLNAAAYGVIARLDGQRTVEAAYDAARRANPDEPADRDALVELIGMLWQSDMLTGDLDIPADAGAMAERAGTTAAAQKRARFINPLFLRVPLVDPDRFLSRSMPLVRPLFTAAGAILWLAAMTWFAMAAAQNWPALTQNASDRILAVDNLLLLAVVFPVLKALHELGHGYAVKRLDGEVREMGLMFLVFLPVPYVDASAAAAFPRSHQRALVGAAGMIVELAVAAAAMAVWLAVEPGLVRSLAFNTMVVASVSTLVFNGNPLLRFDAYFILSDLIEIPNLAQRSNRFYGRMVQRYGFGLPSHRVIAQDRREAVWFAAYAPLAFIYRLVVVFGIALFVSTQYLVLGIVLAAWSVTLSLLWPMAKSLAFVLTSPALSARRIRAIAVTTAGIGGIAALLGAVPLPKGTVVTGLVVPPAGALVVAGADGTVARAAERGAVLTPGAPALHLLDSTLTAEERIAAARVAELRLRWRALLTEDLAASAQVREQLRVAEEDLAEVRAQIDGLTARAAVSGALTLPGRPGLEGSYVRRGTVVGYLDTDAPVEVQAYVPAPKFAEISLATRAIAIKRDSAPFASDTARRIDRVVPQATRQLSDPALSQPLGGPFAIVPGSQPMETVLPFMVVDLTVPEGRGYHYYERVHVRFDHPPETIVARTARALRQLLLERFSV